MATLSEANGRRRRKDEIIHHLNAQVDRPIVWLERPRILAARTPAPGPWTDRAVSHRSEIDAPPWPSPHNKSDFRKRMASEEAARTFLKQRQLTLKNRGRRRVCCCICCISFVIEFYAGGISPLTHHQSAMHGAVPHV